MTPGISAGSITTAIPVYQSNSAAELLGNVGQSAGKSEGESFLEAMLASGMTPEVTQQTKGKDSPEKSQELPEQPLPPSEEEEQPKAQTVTHLMAALLTPPPQQEVEGAPQEDPFAKAPSAESAPTVNIADPQDVTAPAPVDTQAQPTATAQTQQAEDPFAAALEAAGETAQQQPGTVAPILEGHSKEMEPPAQQPAQPVQAPVQQAEQPAPPPQAATQPEDEARMPQATGPIEVSPPRQQHTQEVRATTESDSSCPLENGDDPVEFPPLEQPDTAQQEKPDTAPGQSAQQLPEAQELAKPAEKPLQADQPVDVAPQRAAFADRLQPAAQEQPHTEGVEANRLFDEMVERITNSEQNGMRTMEIQLKPDHLGKVSIQLQLGENGLQAKITADDPSVRSAISGQITQLVEALSEKGIKVAGFEVAYSAVNDTGYDRSPQSGQQQPQQHRHTAAQLGGLAAADAAPAAPQWWEPLPEGVTDAAVSTVEYRA